MKPPSLPLMALIIFWIAYCVVAAYALYQALPPLNRDLLLILGGAAIPPLAVIFASLRKLARLRTRKRALDG